MEFCMRACNLQITVKESTRKYKDWHFSSEKGGGYNMPKIGKLLLFFNPIKT